MAIDKIRQLSAKHKKKMVIAAVILIAAGAVYLCFSSSQNSDGRGQDTALTGAESGLASEPERDADIYGMVTSIKGNQITIMKFDPSTMPGAKKSGSGADEQATTDENAISLGTSSSVMPGAGGGGKMPGGGGMPGVGPGGGSSSTSSTREDKLEELKKTSIGTETVTVPVGIPILVQSSSVDGQTTQEMTTIRDLTSDTVVILWLKPEETQTEVNADGAVAEESSTLHTADYVNIVGKVDMDNSTK
ncbi:MAG: hypothetical protein WCQ96_03925 [Patescibacteria group bacterium]